ncbi:uncharacterized protein [Maniola hyperantus]|uniref:uncharacterized protein isoform X6 n=1 Tax=Aphantopus hyperantus TaxID=2795564 RepID=UPI003748AE32
MKTLKMQCCVPFCQTTAEIVSKSTGITFHKFPNEVPLRAAWLRALGNQDTLLSEHAVVCSLHFLNDEICTTDSGSRQIRTGAIPSMVQVCMICLDAHSKLFLMSKYKLDEAYQHLVGLPLCDPGNLKQTACIQCAQRLMNFSRFRDKSLRARALMMELVGKYELISMQHMGMFNEVNNKLKHNIVKTILHPDHCDLYINSDTDKQTEATASVESVTIKNEENVPMSVDEDDTENVVVRTDTDKGFNINLVVTKEEYLSDEEPKQLTDPLFVKPSTSKEPTELMAPIKYEITFECSICMEEFADEDTYNYHMTMHMEEDQSLTEEPIAEFGHSSSSSSVAPLPWGLVTNVRSLHEGPTTEAIASVVQNVQASDHYLSEIILSEPDRASYDNSIEETIESAVKMAYFSDPNKSETIVREPVCQDYDSSTPETFNLLITIGIVSDRYESETIVSVPDNANCYISETKTETIDPIIRIEQVRDVRETAACSENSLENILNRNLAIRTEEISSTGKNEVDDKPFKCTLCQYKSKYKSALVKHVKMHTGDKPFACDLCEYKCSANSVFVNHLRIHTGEKPFSCKICEYKFARKNDLLRHIKLHLGRKPYSCEVCGHKFARNSDLRCHIKTHTREKPYSCQFCGRRFLRDSGLLKHFTKYHSRQ